MHILQITNHGLHHWDVVPGLPDTGGQNIFVNQFSDALADLGFEITIINRGGFPDPVSGERREGILRKDGRQRILYIEDGLDAFVRKEDMDDRLPLLADDLRQRLEATQTKIDLIISHYWDGAKLGILLNDVLPEPVPHVWIPHSLGAIKKGNLPPEQWAGLRIDERIANELKLVQEVDAVASTSSLITRMLLEFYKVEVKLLFLPPCVDQSRYYPRTVEDEHEVWKLLGGLSGRSFHELRQRKIVTEISRTDITKRKDILIKAFARARQRVPNGFLVVSIDDGKPELADELRALIRSLGIDHDVAAVGSVWDLLPDIYGVTNIYCTPAIVEGFGMSAQEAAATAVPVIASHRVPFAVEYLLGDEIHDILPEGSSSPVQVGEGGVLVEADDVPGFAFALELLLSDDERRLQMGKNAFEATIPYFTWPRMTADFLDQLEIDH